MVVVRDKGDRTGIQFPQGLAFTEFILRQFPPTKTRLKSAARGIGGCQAAARPSYQSNHLSSPTFTMATVNIQQILTDTLSADANVRIAAELKLSEVLQHQGAFMHVERARII
jgi:hypothetical protein